MIDPEDETGGFADSGAWEVPLSALERYAYCPRQAAMVHVEGAWAETADTVRGELNHHSVDLPGLTRRAGVTVIRSLPVSSEVYGLRGICDVVEFTGRIATPVEYKVGRYQPNGPADLQVAGQAICLREAGFEVAMGYVYSVAERRRHPVVIDADLVERVAEAAAAIRQLLTEQRLPIARNDSRCRRCSLRDDCLPEVTDGRVTAGDLFAVRPLGRWRD